MYLVSIQHAALALCLVSALLFSYSDVMWMKMLRRYQMGHTTAVDCDFCYCKHSCFTLKHDGYLKFYVIFSQI